MHRGVRILSIDHSNIRWDEDHLKILQEAARSIRTEKEVRYLVDITGSYISSNVVLRGISILGPEEHKVTRRAFLGANDYKLSIVTLLKTMTFFKGDSKVFRDRQEGLDYLATLAAKKDS